MLASKSMQKLDTVSNISKMDMERQGEFNEALRKKLSYEWKNIYRSLLQKAVNSMRHLKRNQEIRFPIKIY